MKALKLIGILGLIWFLAACGEVTDLPLEVQAPGGCVPSSSPTPCPGWVGLGNPVYVGTNTNDYDARYHRDIEVVVNNQMPTLAYLEWKPVTPGLLTYMRSDLIVSQWNNTTKTWNKLGSAVDATNDDVANFSLAAKGQKIVVAYDVCHNMPDNNCDGGSHSTHVKMWTGTTWQKLGGHLCTMSGGCYPQVALDSNDNPVVVISNPISDIATPQGLTAYRWNAGTSSWVQLGSKLNTYDYVWNAEHNVKIAVDNQNRPIVTFVEGQDYNQTGYLRAKRWNGSSWQNLSLSSSVASTPQTDNFKSSSLTLGAGITPVVAYSLKENGTEKVFVRHLGTCSNSTQIVFPCWKSLGNQASLGAGHSPSLTSYEKTSPLPKTVYALSYVENDNLYVKQLGVSDWSAVGSNPLDVTLSKKIKVHDLAFDGSRPLAVWLEPNPATDYNKLGTVYAKRYQ